MFSEIPRNKTIGNIIEFIPNKLYMIPLREGFVPQNTHTDEQTFCCLDDSLRYESFCLDFGPLDLSKIYRLSQILESKFLSNTSKKVCLYTNSGSKVMSNLICALGCWMVIVLKKNPEDVCKTIFESGLVCVPFRDALSGSCDYKMTVSHCLHALHKGIITNKWFQFEFQYPPNRNTPKKNNQEKRFPIDPQKLLSIYSKKGALFDAQYAEYFEKVENGDITVVVPGKFINFSSPSDSTSDSQGFFTTSVGVYCSLFKKCGVTDVVRLSLPSYNADIFTEAGINHHHLFYEDGTTPPSHILSSFMKIAENAKGLIAVHCKAGLGRTGTCVGFYMMKHYQFSAEEVIAWLRICRPGSILGPQQQFMKK